MVVMCDRYKYQQRKTETKSNKKQHDKKKAALYRRRKVDETSSAANVFTVCEEPSQLLDLIVMSMYEVLPSDKSESLLIDAKDLV
ncbi:hypothetical protein A0J61_05161 [Choanephora cucurbitarum]|uniref:Uncharacterized protein n=1 Tax=Choanephora cucurbitarum TaxID=101091 RepID=A0A1C7NCJ6_9FUNG|nr:hypothetical protein A0J61_05161 [Choanephora cucurbitarum]